jgi:DNA polymerase III epsilon subunit-like protein
VIFLCDFETTGLTKDTHDYLAQPGIVQIGAIVLEPLQNGGKEIKSFKTLVNPERAQWEEGAIKTHGITHDKVENAPTFFAVFHLLAQMAEGCDTWSGYNTKFDRDVLWYQLQRYGFERSFPWPRFELDVMKLARERMVMEGKRGVKSPKLVEIHHHLFNEDFPAHDALEDIRATARVLRELSK